jgi:hypothetical protein
MVNTRLVHVPAEVESDRVYLSDRLLDDCDIFESILLVQAKGDEANFSKNGTRVALRSIRTKKFLGINESNANIYADKETITRTEQFELFYGLVHNRIGLRSVVNGKFMSSQLVKTSHLSMSGSHFGQRQTFELIKIFDKYI